MNCRRVEARLSDHMEGLLQAPEAGAIAAHLDACPACRRLRDTFREIGGELRSLPEPAPSPALRQRAIAAWASERTNDERSMARFVLRLSGAVAAAALLLALGLSLHGGIKRGREHRGAPAPALAQREMRSGELPDTNKPAVARPITQRLKSRLGRREVHRRGLGSEPAKAGFVPLQPRLQSLAHGEGHRPLARTPGMVNAQEPTPDDLLLLNGDSSAIGRRWMALPAGARERIEAGARRDVAVADDFVQIMLPRLATLSDTQIAAAVESYRREAAVRDPLLSREVSVRERAIPLADLCERLRQESGVHLTAGRNIADEKVTILCRPTPLRDVMRQLSRPFGYTWLRSRRTTNDPRILIQARKTTTNNQHSSELVVVGRSSSAEYRYELVQDLRSQLVEEALRNRGRQEALLALDRELQEYRRYLGLTPGEIRRRMASAAPEEKQRLEKLAGVGWGMVQMYHRLSPREMAALRAGRTLIYSAAPERDQQPLPPEVAGQVVQSLSHRRILLRDGVVQWGDARSLPEGVAPAAVPGLRPTIDLQLVENELGQLGLTGGVELARDDFRLGSHLGRPPESAAPLALGMSPSALRPDNRATNARLARNPAFRKPTHLQPRHVCQGVGHQDTDECITSADLLEALHEATGMSVVGDFYTRLYPASAGAATDQSLFNALNRTCDAMGLRWSSSDGGWLQLRSAAYFNDRLKEVPRRLLAQLSAIRREQGVLPLEELLQIAQLTDAQLDAGEMAEGARRCWGLAEWEVARSKVLRPHLRFLGALSPSQLREALHASGLSFRQLTLPQQQEFIRLSLGDSAESLTPTLEKLAEATVRVGYRIPGWFECANSTQVRAPMPSAATRLLAVRERTREAALTAARRLDPTITEAQIADAKEPDVMVIYTVGEGDQPEAQRVVSLRGHGFSTR